MFAHVNISYQNHSRGQHSYTYNMAKIKVSFMSQMPRNFLSLTKLMQNP